MNDLMNLINVEVEQGIIKFPAYETLKDQALEVAQIVAETEVTEDNIKQSKKMIASVNKSVKELESRRVAVKKAMLEPYNEFEKQIKEIVGIVKEADEVVRSQVNKMEEIEREAKCESIEDVWKKRIQHYDFKGIVIFEDFLTPQHLNKTMTLKKVEEEMVKFLESTQADLNVINAMENSAEILDEYDQCKNLALAMQTVNDRNQRVKQIETVHESDSKQSITIFIIKDKKDAAMVEMLLPQYNIKFEKETR